MALNTSSQDLKQNVFFNSQHPSIPCIPRTCHADFHIQTLSRSLTQSVCAQILFFNRAALICTNCLSGAGFRRAICRCAVLLENVSHLYPSACVQWHTRAPLPVLHVASALSSLIQVMFYFRRLSSEGLNGSTHSAIEC